MAHGRVTLIGSGETTAVGAQVLDVLLAGRRRPYHMAMLETPAGFELNSPRVLGRVADFFGRHLGPRGAIQPLAARRRDGPGGTDDAAISAQLSGMDAIYLGAGSPTYAIHHLRGTQVWEAIRRAWHTGTDIVLASAAAIAASRFALPVYEIFKVGLDPFWMDGLDLLGDLGVSAAIVPHWNNPSGGDELDTSRCFVGQVRFDALQARLPANVTTLGLDEQTALILDLKAGDIEVLGSGALTIRYGDATQSFAARQHLPTGALGDVFRSLSDMFADASPADAAAPAEVQQWAAERAAARAARDWPLADALRARITTSGWQIEDGPEGYTLRRG